MQLSAAAQHHNLFTVVGPICSTDLSKLHLAHGVLEQEGDCGAVMPVPQRSAGLWPKGVSLVQVIRDSNCNYLLVMLMSAFEF